MKPTRITVDLRDKPYDVVVGCDILVQLGTQMKALNAGAKVGLVVHPRVMRLYGQKVIEGLRKSGFSVFVILVPEGERNKNLAQIQRIYDKLVAYRFERSSWLMALGGGVIGDMTGFAAATFLRGISYVQCPTTVIAQVDAAIGGKTGVDHSKGKNLIGAFHHPALVYIDLSVLATLPKREFVSGLAEVIKYGIIDDADFFDFLEKQADAILKRDMKLLAICVERSVRIKAAIVAADERESGLRKILNYGHTWGHAFETVTDYKQYKHGEAISMGMMAAAQMAHQWGISPFDLLSRQSRLLKLFGLPVNFPRVDRTKLLNLLYSDKKVIGEEVHFVLPQKIGSVSVQKVGRLAIEKILKNLCLN